MRLVLLFCLIVFLQYSCTQEDKNSIAARQLINDVFLTVVDTQSYAYRSLIPSGAPVSLYTDSVFPIAVSTSVLGFKGWENQIASVLHTSSLVEFESLWSNGQRGRNLAQFNIRELTNLDKYKLVEGYDFSRKENTGVLGTVMFTPIVFNENYTKGLFVVVIKDDVKSSKTNLVLVQKQEGIWNVIETILIEVS